MKDAIIIIDIVIDRSSDTEIAQLCSSLSSLYYTKTALAATPYVFGWGPSGLSNPIKIKVGAVEYLLSLNVGILTAKLLGTCNSGHWSKFAVSGQTLEYDDGSFQFTTNIELDNGVLNITIEANSNTSIEARD